MTSFSGIVLSTSLLMLLAELGDKTNLIQISLVARHRQPISVLLGAMLGISIVTIIGVLIGSTISTILPPFLIPILSGIVFIYLGISQLRSEDDDEVLDNNDLQGSILLRSSYLVGLAEFGDKSQIFVISNAALNNPLAVLIGAVIGMGIISLLAVFFGMALLTKIPEEKLHKIAAILFIVAGIWIILTSL